MSNPLDLFGRAPAPATGVSPTAALLAGLDNVQNSLPAGANNGVPYLTFKDGAWVYGPEAMEVEKGAKLAVNIGEMEHGWILWQSRPRALVHEFLGPVSQPLRAADTLPAPPADKTCDPWAQSYALPMVIVSGSDNGTKVLFKTNSLGGAQAIRALIAEISKQALADPQHVYPVVTLDGSSYENKNYGKTIHTPILRVVEWFNPSAPPAWMLGGAPVAAAPVTSPAPAGPAPTPARGPAPEPAAVPDDTPFDADPAPAAAAAPAPGRRRRVAAAG